MPALNLVVNGLLIQAGNPSLNMFDITRVGVPCALAGLAYMIVFSQWLLPNRRLAIRLMDNPREHTVEMLVDGASSVGGTNHRTSRSTTLTRAVSGGN